MIFVVHSFHSLSYLLTEPKGLQHFHVLAIPEYFLLEIECRTQVKGEDAVIVVSLNLVLRFVHLQVADIVGLSCRNLQLHGLNLDILLGNDAKASIEEILGIPVLRHQKSLVLDVETSDAVEPVDPRSFLGIVGTGA